MYMCLYKGKTSGIHLRPYAYTELETSVHAPTMFGVSSGGSLLCCREFVPQLSIVVYNQIWALSLISPHLIRAHWLETDHACSEGVLHICHSSLPENDLFAQESKGELSGFVERVAMVIFCR